VLELLVTYQAMLQLGHLSNFFNHGLIVLIPKWDLITLLVCKGGLGVINLRAQVEALLTKLVV
jgi:hypothetical protein